MDKEKEVPLYQQWSRNSTTTTSSTPPGYPLLQTSTHPGVAFVDTPQERKFTSSGGCASYDNGVEISIPPNSVQQKSTIGITVQPSLAPKSVFVMPEGIQSASPSYLISNESPKDLSGEVTITMEHHVNVSTKQDAESLVFLEADPSPKRSASGCTYQFEEVKEGRSEFTPGENTGRLTGRRLSKKFLKIGAKMKKWFRGSKASDHAHPSKVNSSPSTVPNLYSVRVYRSPPQTTGSKLAIICVSLYGQLYSKFLSVLDNEIIPRDYPDVSAKMADRTTLGSLTFSEPFARLNLSPLPGWQIETDKEVISKNEADQPEMEHFKPEDLHDYPPRIVCRFYPEKNVVGRATCSMTLAGLVPDVKVHIPLKAPELKVAVVDTARLQAAAGQLRSFLLTVNHTELGSAVCSVVSLMEKLSEALSLSSLSDLSTHTESINTEIKTVLAVSRRVAEECTRHVIKESIDSSIPKLEVLSHQLNQVAKVKLKHCQDQSEETSALIELIECGANLLRTAHHLLRDMQTLGEMDGSKVLTVESLKRNIQVSDTQLDMKITEQDIHNIAGQFGEVEIYLYKLNLSPSQQTNVKDLAHQCNTKVAVAKALLLWRQPNPFVATFRALLEILLDLQRGDVAISVCNYITKKLIVT